MRRGEDEMEYGGIYRYLTSQLVSTWEIQCERQARQSQYKSPHGQDSPPYGSKGCTCICIKQRRGHMEFVPVPKYASTPMELRCFGVSYVVIRMPDNN